MPFFFLIILFLPFYAWAQAPQSDKVQVLAKDIIEDGTINIAVQPVPAPPNLPPAGKYPIDAYIRTLARRDSFVIFPDEAARRLQIRYKTLKANRNAFKNWSKEGIRQLDSYMIEHKGSLNALNDIQNMAKIIECFQAGGTPKQCAVKFGVSQLSQYVGGQLLTYLGVGSIATLGAVAYADYQAVLNCVELYNEATGLIEDLDLAQRQAADRRALGTDVRNIKSYMDLVLTQYEQKQDKVGEELVSSWMGADEENTKLGNAIDDFVRAWKDIETKQYPDQLFGQGHKILQVNETCTALARCYTRLTGQNLPAGGSSTGLLTATFKDKLAYEFNTDYSVKSTNIRKELEAAVQKPVQSLHFSYERLDVCLAQSLRARAAFLTNTGHTLQTLHNLNQHYEQQLAERFGKSSPIYNEGMALLEKTKQQIENYRPPRIGKNWTYISDRIDNVSRDFKFIKNRFNKVLLMAAALLEDLDSTDSEFQRQARQKARALASSLETCAEKTSSRASAADMAPDLLSWLEEVKAGVNQTRLLAQGGQNACSAAGARIISVTSRADSVYVRLNAAQALINKRLQSAEALTQKQSELTGLHTRIQEQTEKILGITYDIEATSLETCKRVQTLKNTAMQPSRRQETYEWIASRKEKFKSDLDTIREILSRIETKFNLGKEILSKELSAKEAGQDTQTLQKEIDSIVLVHNSLSSAINEISSGLETFKNTASKTAAAKSRWTGRIYEINKVLNTLPATSGITKLKKQLAELEAQLASVRIIDCRQNIGSKLEQANKRMTRNDKLLAQVNNLFQSGKNVIINANATRELANRTLAQTGYLVDMGKAYLERAVNSAGQGALCTVLADNLMASDNLCKKIKGAVPVWNARTGKMSCKCPSPLVPDKAGSACISKKQAALEKTDCSQWPGTVPAWDNARNQPGCACPQEMLWSKDAKKCIDADQPTEEICGDGIDNDGDMQIDEGCSFARQIILDDNECPDDTMELIVDGISYGRNPAGHIRYFNVSGLSYGAHTVEIYGVESGGSKYKNKNGTRCSNNKVITCSIELGQGISFSGGSSKKFPRISQGKSVKYEVMVK